jgi:hypothetical protein
LLHPSHPELTAYLLKQLKIADSNYDRLCEEFAEEEL